MSKRRNGSKAKNPPNSGPRRPGTGLPIRETARIGGDPGRSGGVIRRGRASETRKGGPFGRPVRGTPGLRCSVRAASGFFDAATDQADVAELAVVEGRELAHGAAVVAITLELRADLSSERIDRHLPSPREP